MGSEGLGCGGGEGGSQIRGSLQQPLLTPPCSLPLSLRPTALGPGCPCTMGPAPGISLLLLMTSIPLALGNPM